VPTAPIIQSTNGKKSTVRTYQNLLKDQHDEELFDYYFTSQLLLVNSENGKAKKIGEPAIYMSVEFSPDNKYLLASRINKPYSYLLPYYYFPKSYLIFDKAIGSSLIDKSKTKRLLLTSAFPSLLLNFSCT
jgi:hypothetical protein